MKSSYPTVFHILPGNNILIRSEIPHRFYDFFFFFPSSRLFNFTLIPYPVFFMLPKRGKKGRGEGGGGGERFPTPYNFTRVNQGFWNWIVVNDKQIIILHRTHVCVHIYMIVFKIKIMRDYYHPKKKKGTRLFGKEKKRVKGVEGEKNCDRC